MLLGNLSFREEHKGKMTFCPGSVGPGSGPPTSIGGSRGEICRENSLHTAEPRSQDQ